MRQTLAGRSGGLLTHSCYTTTGDTADGLVRESYKAELKGKELTLNASIPRIVKRYEAAFADVGIEFFKTRPARLFLSKIAKEPEKTMPTAAIERFERLFGHIGRVHTKITGKSGTPFS